MKKSKYHSNHREAMNTFYLNSSIYGGYFYDESKGIAGIS